MVKNKTIKDDRNARQQSSSSDADDGPDERRMSRGVSVTIGHDHCSVYGSYCTEHLNLTIA